MPSFRAALAALVVLLPAAALAAQSASNESFTASLSGGPCAAGAACRVSLSVETKGSSRMHKPLICNMTSAPPDATVTIGKGSDTRATATVTFTPARSGTTKVCGEVTVSTIRGENTLMDKVELCVDVDVK